MQNYDGIMLFKSVKLMENCSKSYFVKYISWDQSLPTYLCYRENQHYFFTIFWKQRNLKKCGKRLMDLDNLFRTKEISTIFRKKKKQFLTFPKFRHNSIHVQNSSHFLIWMSGFQWAILLFLIPSKSRIFYLKIIATKDIYKVTVRVWQK